MPKRTRIHPRVQEFSAGRAGSGVSAGGGQILLPLSELVGKPLLELVVDVGIRGVHEILEGERERLCGPRYARPEERSAYRHGHAAGELVLGGRRVRLRRPRVRSLQGSELPLPTWEFCRGEDPLNQRAVAQIAAGVATRQYAGSLEAFDGLDTFSDGRSAVSRRFKAVTAKRLAEFMARPLNDLKPAVVMIDGVRLGGHVVLVALGVDEDGKKHVLGLHEGATENAASCERLLADLVGRGLATDRSLLFVLDGAKALHKAVSDVFGGRALIQRCQVHKKRNVTDHLPKNMHRWVGAALSAAYGCGNAVKAKKQLLALVGRLEDEHPSAAASLREGLDETLTVLRLELPAALERTLVSTNVIECLMSRVQALCGRVKRWRGGSMVLRWAALGLTQAERGFRRVKGAKKGMGKLTAALRENDVRRDAAGSKLEKQREVA